MAYADDGSSDAVTQTSGGDSAIRTREYNPVQIRKSESSRLFTCY
jgi:hypothetical protein